MHELVTELLSYLQNATRYKWLALLSAWGLCLAGWIFVSQMPDEFKADARVHVDTQSMLRPLLNGMAIQPDLSAQIKLMSKVMFSRPILEKVVRKADLDLKADDDKAMENLINTLQTSMKIAGGENNLFTISATDADPRVAKNVVQSLLDIFIDQTFGESREDSENARKFLEEQIKEYETRLKAAESTRETFKREHFGFLPDQGGDLYTKLNALNAQLDEAKMAAQDATHKRDELRKQLNSENPSVAGAAGELSPIDQRIQALQAKLDELLLRFTKGHPEVVAVRNSIFELEKQKQEQGKSAKSGAADSPAREANPVFQQMKLALSEAEANVASLNSRVRLYQDKIKNLNDEKDERLHVETELQGLNRDYDAINVQYEDLLKRREKLRLSDDLGNTESVKFRIIDPPQVPSKPFAPNRILFSAGVLIGSLLVGAGLAVFLSLLRPTFASSQKVREITGLPVLGSVSMNWISEIKQRKRREFFGFAVGFASLVLMFLAVVLLEINGVNLRQLSI